MMSVELLASQRMFRGVSQEQLEALVTAGNTFNISKAYVLIEEGQSPRHIYFIMHGEVEVVVSDPDRAVMKRLTTLGPGECVGEYGFIDGRPASATVRATETSQVFALAIPLLKNILQTDHELERLVYRNLLTTLVERLRTSNVIIEFLQYQDELKSAEIH